jgi:ATP/maltotriose-dependent transcriptional regulator MalT
LASFGLGPLDRAKLLPAQAEVALLLGDVETARAAATELDSIAGVNGAPALRATADAAAAAVALADGDLARAGSTAQRARALFDEIDLVYESAKVSTLLGRIRRAEGDEPGARADLTTALDALTRIGATPDAIRTRELLGAL